MHESDFCVGVLKRSMYFSISTYDFEYLHEIDFADDKEGKGSKISIQSRINKMNEKWKERFNKRSCLFMKIDQIHKVNLDMVYFTLVNLRFRNHIILSKCIRIRKWHAQILHFQVEN